MSSAVEGMLEADVAVVGAGPTGLTLANLLGMYGVRTVLVEKSSRGDVVTYPRAVGIDHDALRTFQALGIVDDLLPNIIQNTAVRFFARDGSTLVELERQSPGTAEAGWYRRNMFMQHLAERVLVDGLSRFSCVRLLDDTAVTGLTQDQHSVSLTVEPSTGGRAERLEVGRVVGADGARSTIRKLVSITLNGDTYEEPWLICEVDGDPWDAPYSAFFCDPARPVYSGQLPHGHRRFGLMLLPGETDAEAVTPEGMRRLLGPLVPRFDDLNVIRAHVYRHQARLASRFVRGRVTLIGDAAHLMPPWAGQGLNTGIRDATNLAWKLAAIERGVAEPTLLETYHSERYAHADQVIAMTRRFGKVFIPRDRRVAAVRDAALAAVKRMPGLSRRFNREWFGTPLRYEHGLVHRRNGRQHPTVGCMFIQPRVGAGGDEVPLDDVLGPWFAVVSYRCDPSSAAPDAATFWRSSGARLVRVELSNGSRRRGAETSGEVQDTYGALETWFRTAGVDFAVVRPDRIVAAVGMVAEFGAITSELGRGLGSPATDPDERRLSRT